MSQLKISDAMDAVEAVKKEVEEIKAKSCCGGGEANEEVIERITALEFAIVELKKEIRSHVEMYNQHILNLHG